MAENNLIPFPEDADPSAPTDVNPDVSPGQSLVDALDDVDASPEFFTEHPTQALTMPPAMPIAELLPPDFRLPDLIKFVPNQELIAKLEMAVEYANGVEIEGQGLEGLKVADAARQAVINAKKGVEANFEEAVSIAYGLHKRLTILRAQATLAGDACIQAVGRTMYAESQRLERIAAEARRKAQEQADRQAREDALHQAQEAAKHQAPAEVVEQLQAQAENASAPPVHVSSGVSGALANSGTVTKWRVRFAGCSDAPIENPSPEEMTPAQRMQLLVHLKAVLGLPNSGNAPIQGIDVNWAYYLKRAGADKDLFDIPGLEAYKDGGMRSKPSRGKR